MDLGFRVRVIGANAALHMHAHWTTGLQTRVV